MTVDDAPVTTGDEFHRRLQALVRAANSNGVDVEGGWPVVGDDTDTPEWDVEIVVVDREE